MLHLSFLFFFILGWLLFLHRALLLAGTQCSREKRDGSAYDEPEASSCFDRGGVGDGRG